MAGHLISFEGLDGVGKSTQVELLAASLRCAGIPVCVYREPGGTPLGEELRRLLQSGTAKGSISELLLFVAARAELVELEVRPALAQGDFVILDRFADSTWAYQGARGIQADLLRSANSLGTGGLEPELTFWLDLEPAAAKQRRRDDGRNAAQREADAFEQRGESYFARVRERYRQLADANPERIVVLDAGQPADKLAREIHECAVSRLKLRTKKQEPVAA